MEALIASSLSVAIAEIGDKTQLLALLLTLRFAGKDNQQPGHKRAIILGILIATLVNHLAAAWTGQWALAWLDPALTRYLVAAAFFAIALWVLVPDKVEARESRLYRLGPFIATALLFFIAEMGDKTQIATLVLAAKYQSLPQVVAGSTLGMLLANVPVVLAASMGAGRIPLTFIHRGCAALFALLGLATLML
jgi:Ca2+/H+ antiporter, TMEM165/GDT1 family